MKKTAMEATQWYAIWGLVPIGNVVDSQAMAGGTADYDIQTQFSFLDMLISGFTSAVTIQRQTVTVTK